MSVNDRRRAKTTLLSAIDSDEFYHTGSPAAHHQEERQDIGNNQPAFTPIEVPFAYRHCCWFCKEPAGGVFNFPDKQRRHVTGTAEGMAIPACFECLPLANKHKQLPINAVREKVKAGLRKLYRKDLAIGVNWTREELENSGFEGGNFEGFARSAWFMFEVARDRVNFSGWPLELNGQTQYHDPQSSFQFDGTEFSDVQQAIEFYALTYRLDQDFLTTAVYRLTDKRFADALRLARICQDFSAAEREQALSRLALSLGV
ncbi:hypothetical protein [Thalassotalea mangrovi]|uniref:Uncharacterized protein n=1 Tax=Thalassotalea mangrovi TaxID=2572245 RepID=A0A4U1B4G4_9GAMM|nr:hypothetical protein [Thalassotalea mangrovi]TKB45067.1 hypothetical protein E8M12_09535 [Thalassotalea mangrovi]